MTALISSPALALDCERESAYEKFWHAMEDDVSVPDFDADEHDADFASGDVYFEYVSSIEA